MDLTIPTILSSIEENADIMTFSFSGFDYLVFVVMLGISLSIGIYFGFFSGSPDTTDEYLLGGKKMKVWPIAISLVASQLSGIAVMSVPAEMYSFGTTYGLIVVAMAGVLPIINFVIIPVFYNNNISNCYEYLEMRFDKKTRQIVTIAFIVTVYLILPVIIFIPALAFSQVTGINIHLINGIVCAVCVCYTMLGGIKAVVWTDVVQATIMLVSVVLVAAMGINKVGGVGEVLYRANEGGRLNMFNMTFDLTTRATFWNSFFGGIGLWTSYVGLNQSCVQRIVALPTLSHARRSLTLFAIGFFIIMFLNCFTGIIMYARYYECDPVQAGVVEKTDKMMPYFVQDIVGHLKGIPGLFISCVFSAALSTMSANLNSLSGVVYFDYIRPYIKHTERRANLIMKMLVIVTGIYCVIGGIVVEKFTSILQMVITIAGISQGAVLGVFLFGMLYPRGHSKAAFIATVISMILMTWLIIGAQVKIRQGELKYSSLPTTIEGCDDLDINVIYKNQTVPHIEDDSFSIYKISFNWYILIGSIAIWVFAVPLSFLMENNDKKLNKNLMSPVVQHFIPKDILEPEDIPLKSGYKDSNNQN